MLSFLADSIFVVEDTCQSDQDRRNDPHWCRVPSTGNEGMRGYRNTGTQWVGELAGLLLLFLCMAYTVVQEHQYEVIIVPALLVGGFLILLAIILWLFIRGQRSQRQHPGTRCKTQAMELGIGSGKIDFMKVIGQGFHRSNP